ncbi:MAG TPA: LamG-like jellyroll fold domain-containing protein [Chitinophagales bacterium]|nr:LamG-like jellyroll fold domain-containing protein [Chitinophagales bacterium]
MKNKFYLLFALALSLFSNTMVQAQSPTMCSGNCLNLIPGGFGYANAGDLAAYNNMSAITMAAWVNTTSLPADGVFQTIIGKWGDGAATDNQFALLMTRQGSVQYIRAQIGIGGTAYTISAPSTIAANTWAHVAFTWQSGGVPSIYINGVAIATGASAITGTINSSSVYSVRMGFNNRNGETAFPAYLDEVQVYDVALTSAQINAYKNTTLYSAPFYNRLRGYWRFQDPANNFANEIAPFTGVGLSQSTSYRGSIIPCQVPDFNPNDTLLTFPASNNTILLVFQNIVGIYPLSDPSLGSLKYVIFRDSVAIDTVSPQYGSFTYTDNTLTKCRNKYFGKKIWIYPNGTVVQGPATNTVNGATPDYGFRASQGLYVNKTVLTWNNLGPAGGYEIRRNGQIIAQLTNQNATTFTDFDGTPGVRYDYTLIPITNPLGVYLVCDETGWVKENGRLSGYVKSPLNAPVPDVIVTATGTVLGQTYTYRDTTDASGFYEIRNVYYNEEATYTLTPSKGTHQFNPPSLQRTLDLLAFNAPQANFTDTSVFTISGQVYFPNQAGNPGCGSKDVKILVNGQDVGIITNATGQYTYTAQDEGLYTFKPVYANHTFSPPVTSMVVVDNVPNLNFQDATTDTLWLDLKGYCETQIASSFLFKIEGTSSVGCYTLNVPVDGNLLGGYPLVLPAQQYSVELISVTTGNANVETAIVNSFQGLGNRIRNVDLRNRDSVTQRTIVANPPVITIDTIVLGNGQVAISRDTLITYDTILQTTRPAAEAKYVYGGRLSLELLGIDASCGGNVVFKQGNLYQMRIRVWRNYNYLGNQSCPVDTGRVTVFDDVSDSSFIYFTLDTFFVNYSINPGKPNISGSGAHPYQKFITIHAQTWDASAADTSFWAVVEGNRSLTNTFITKTPELPLFILHDPMGDGSSTTLEQGTSLSYGYSTGMESGLASNTYLNVSVGAEIPVPFTGIVFSAGGQLNLSIATNEVNTSNQSVNTTFTTLNTYSTSDNDNFIGEEADVVVGGSFNMIYGLSYIVKMDSATCQPDLDTALIWGAQDFATTYSYTIGHIKNTLIPQLNYLIGFYNNLGSDSALIYQNYKNVWEQVVDKNHANITNAEFVENRSFSGGVTYSYNTTNENSSSMSITYQSSINPTIAAALNVGTEQNNVEAGTEVNFSWTTSKVTDNSSSSSKSVTYTLNDKDPGDFFSIDVKRDKVYGTPAFKLSAGTSSCPHEEGTQQRDYPEILVTTPNVQNVPINSQATLTVQMSNFSESNETRTYEVIVDPNSNLDGAVVRLAGQIITQAPATFTIPANGSVFATLSVEAGPIAVDYNGIKLIIYSPCDPNISDETQFNVGFQSTCSDVTLFTPSNNWLVNDGSDTLRITYGAFNVNDTSLLQIGLEIRRTGQSWAGIASSIVSRAQLQQNGLPYYALDINMGNLADGPYEIRAYADCATAGSRSYSVALSGIIDRTSVTLFGTPSPADGVLNINEEVSVSFSEDIDCSHYFNLQTLIPYAVTLVRTDNGNPVNFTYTCSGNKILFNLDSATLSTVQNVLLTAAVSGFYDINGNIQQYPVVWSFVVNNSPVFWQPSGVSASVATGGAATLTGTLKNLSQSAQSFTLSSVPSWLSPAGVPGSIAQGASLNINFNVSGAGLNPGIYNDTVYADFTGLGIQQPLYIQLSVYANSPSWVVVTQPSQMNIIANFSLTSANAPLSADANDRIGVFFGNECRGVANIQYTPAGNTYAAYITVYGNNGVQPQESFEFRMWDASTGTEYKAVETQTFVENAQVGQPLAPMLLHPAGIVQRIPLATGWNWVSTYLQPNNAAVSDIMKYTANTTGSIIKTNDSYAQYTAATNSWFGTLGQISWQKSYQVMVTAPTELQVIGQRLTDTVSLPVVTGWNWIGFPQSKINTASNFMQSFNSSSGDVLQSSTQFSTYAANTWNGSLQNMQPGRGYKLKSGTTGNILVEPRSVPAWNPDIFGNEFNMNVTAVVKANGTELIGNFIVGAFINGNCVGVSAPQYAGGSPRVFLTLHGDVADNNLNIQFLIYDYNTDSIYTPTHTPLAFTTDAQEGTIETAYPLNLETPLAIRHVARDADFVLHQNVPNPFNGNTMIRVDMPREEQVNLQIFDYTGKLIAQPVNSKLSQGTHTLQFNPENLAPGIYFYRMQAGEFSATKRMVIQ